MLGLFNYYTCILICTNAAAYTRTVRECMLHVGSLTLSQCHEALRLRKMLVTRDDEMSKVELCCSLAFVY